jgi:hypothetical protein
MARMPYTTGIFQYCLLYACHQPGINHERLVAILGICFFAVTIFCVLSFKEMLVSRPMSWVAAICSLSDCAKREVAVQQVNNSGMNKRNTLMY